MNTCKNVIVGQSGGPTAAINSSLAGVIKAGVDSECVGRVYGMVNGIAGMLQKKIVELDWLGENEEKLSLLRKTPASYLGTCRFKLPKEDEELYERIFDILEEYNVGYFFYIGGNDSMDTAAKLAKYADEKGKDIKFVGVSKTIDNDLPETDHTPGFGSAAKFIAATVRETATDAYAYDIKSIEIIETMGRDAGWLAGSSALAGIGGVGPDLIYMPEKEFDLEKFYADVEKLLEEKNHAFVVISEGIRTADGKYICDMISDLTADAFGHRQLGGAGKILGELAKQKFNVKVRSIELNTPQRCASHILSKTDIDEAYNLGYRGVEATLSGRTGVVVIMKRKSDCPYEIEYEVADVNKIANVVKKVPDNYINDEGNYVTEEFIKYVKPLVEGEIIPEYENGVPKFLVLDK